MDDITFCISSALVTPSRLEYLKTTLSSIEKVAPGSPVRIALDKGTTFEPGEYDLDIKVHIHSSGLGHSLNWCIANSDTKYVYQLEDDFPITASAGLFGAVITKGKQLLDEHGGIVRLDVTRAVDVVKLKQNIISTSNDYEITEVQSYGDKKHELERYSNRPHLKLQDQAADIAYLERASPPEVERDIIRKYHSASLPVFITRPHINEHIGYNTIRDYNNSIEVNILDTNFRALTDAHIPYVKRGFWQEVNDKRWEYDTFKALKGELQPDMIFIDIGAWIGPIALFASRNVKEVHAFECDPVASRELARNVRLNGFKNIKLNKVAISDSTGSSELNYRTYGDSTSSLLKGNRGNTVPIECVRLDEYIEEKGLISVDFVKMDIEGGEISVLPDIKQVLLQYKPALHLSLHIREIGKLPGAREAVLGTLKIFNKFTDDHGKPITLGDIDKLFDAEPAGNHMLLCKF